MKKYNILIYPCGSEIGMELHRSLSDDKHFELFGLDSVPNSHGTYIYRNYFGNAPEMKHMRTFSEYFQGFVKRYKIDIIFPANDDAIISFKSKESLFPPIAGPSFNICEICRSKHLTYMTLQDIVKVPICYSTMDEIEFPAFEKPDKGAGSKNAKIINSELDIKVFDPDYVYMEYLPGEEYTIDCFTNSKNQLLYVGPRKRARIKSGISVGIELCHDQIFHEIAKSISSELCMRGAWFFQMKRDKFDKLTLLEIATRIGGSSGIQRYLGVNLPLLTAWDLVGKSPKILKNTFNICMDRPLDSNFNIDLQYDHIYVDLNDTLIIDGKVNYKLMAFLYQCKNKEKKIYLVSSYDGDMSSIMKDANLPDMFDKIIHINKSQDKADFIINLPAIFIDDSYAERLRVHQRGIPTFDICAIDCLMENLK